MGRKPEINKASTRKRDEGGGERRISRWARTGRSKATHKRTGAANTGGGAVMVDKCNRRGGRRPINIVRDRLSIVSEMNAIMWAIDGRSMATHNQDTRAANN